MIKVGSIVKASGVICKVVDVGQDEDGKVWVECTPIEFASIAREFPEEEVEVLG